jgi:hypothetical protein
MEDDHIDADIPSKVNLAAGVGEVAVELGAVDVTVAFDRHLFCVGTVALDVVSVDGMDDVISSPDRKGSRDYFRNCPYRTPIDNSSSSALISNIVRNIQIGLRSLSNHIPHLHPDQRTHRSTEALQGDTEHCLCHIPPFNDDRISTFLRYFSIVLLQPHNG